MPAADGHVIDEWWAEGSVPFDKCAKCGKPIVADWTSGRLVTMVGANAECYGRRP